MNRIICFVALLAFSACNNNTDNSKTAVVDSASVASAPEDVTCYIHTDGLKNQDTTFLRIVTKEDVVSGTLNYMPYEKDRAMGFIHGKQDGALITGIWSYTIEGSQDSVAVAFKLTKEGILQKQAVYNNKTNSIYIPDTAQYSIVYRSVDCSYVRF